MSLSKTFAGANGNADSGGALSVTGINATGYTHVVVMFKHEGAATTLTPSHNQGTASWASLTKESHTNGDLHGQLFWSPIGSPGTGLSVTVTPSASRAWRAMLVWLVNASGGTLELDAQTTAEGSGSAIDAGTLSTTGVSVVSFMGIAPYAGGNQSFAAGWTEDFDAAVNSVSVHGASRGPETTAPIDPAATWTASDAWAAVAASFREPAAGGSIEGTLSSTLGALTSSASGTVDVTGNAAQTLGAVTVTGTGVSSITGTAASTLGALTVAGTGVSSVTGILAHTLGTLTLIAFDARVTISRLLRRLGLGFGTWW